MRAHIDALKALLASLGRDVYYGAAPASPALPYLLLWSSSGRPGVEVGIDGVRADIDDQIGLTAVAATPTAVLALQRSARAILSPAGAPLDVEVAGWDSVLTLDDSRPIAVDADVTIASSGAHPAYGVDMYRLRATPA